MGISVTKFKHIVLIGWLVLTVVPLSIITHQREDTLLLDDNAPYALKNPNYKPQADWYSIGFVLPPEKETYTLTPAEEWIHKSWLLELEGKYPDAYNTLTQKGTVAFRAHLERNNRLKMLKFCLQWKHSWQFNAITLPLLVGIYLSWGKDFWRSINGNCKANETDNENMDTGTATHRGQSTS